MLPTSRSEYEYVDARHGVHHRYLDGSVLDILATLQWPRSNIDRRVLELGCGNGSFAKIMSDRGYHVIGADTSISGIQIAKSHFSKIEFNMIASDEDLLKRFGKFSVIVCLEVIEHVYAPRNFVSSILNALEPGGIAIISTPYHSYIKNFLLSITGKMDAHFTALWDHGHIKFWSMKTLTSLLREVGFADVRFRRVGRLPVLAKSMIAIATRR